MTARPDITASPNDQNTTGEMHITSGSRRTVCSALHGEQHVPWTTYVLGILGLFRSR